MSGRWPLSRYAGRAALFVIGLFVVVLLDGCYYVQAAKGQYEVMRKRQPVAEVIDDPDADAQLRKRLEMVLDARQFAVDELELPDNDSYRSYADLQRDFVLWNVFAAPEFSLTPLTWCYPVAGCVAYRGYFKEASARRKADALEADGYDVSVGGVAAYSTLGRFADPVLSTMLRWSDADLVATLFHELAHQQLYLKGATEFNESFATAVADIGLEKWFAARDAADELAAYRHRRSVRRQLLDLMLDARTDLEVLYTSGQEETAMRVAKSSILEHLVEDAERLARQQGTGTSNWLRPPLNNARLASIGLYENQVPAFLALYDECSQELRCFYAAAEELAGYDDELRRSRLGELSRAAAGSFGTGDAGGLLGTDR